MMHATLLEEFGNPFHIHCWVIGITQVEVESTISVITTLAVKTSIDYLIYDIDSSEECISGDTLPERFHTHCFYL